eukprot:Gb_41035 [translate_table: standard]
MTQRAIHPRRHTPQVSGPWLYFADCLYNSLPAHCCPLVAERKKFPEISALSFEHNPPQTCYLWPLRNIEDHEIGNIGFPGLCTVVIGAPLAHYHPSHKK